MNKNNGGRKKGSGNKVSKPTSANIKEWLTEQMNKSLKYFHVIPNEKKVAETRKQMELILRYCDTQTKEEVSESLYLKLAPHFEALPTYFSHLPVEQKFTECRKFLALLKPEHIEEIGKLLSRKGRNKDE